MSQDARFDDEQSTLKRARILGLPYIDTSQITNKILYKDILSKDELYRLRIILFKQTQIQLLLVLLIQHPKQQYPASNNDF